jgi:hypothetical protein
MPQAVVWPCFIIATFKGPPPFNWAAFRSYAASGLRGVAALLIFTRGQLDLY